MSDMLIIFCSDPMNGREPDSAYADEAAAVESLGIKYSLVSYEALVYEDDSRKAVRKVAESNTSELGVYRGWMLRPDSYEKLYGGLLERGVRLINDPAAYKHCHYLPESYSIIRENTPETVWIKYNPGLGMEEIMGLLRPFGSAPIIVKDFVKSRKHEWEEACYIPSASDKESVERVVRRFIELQDEDMSEGLVFRRFVELEPLVKHSKSGMPLTVEFRIFFLDGEPAYQTRYWEEGDYLGVIPPISDFLEVAGKVKSRFFTMYIAKQRDGKWVIMELGDGQVAGLPESADVKEFYSALQAHLMT